MRSSTFSSDRAPPTRLTLTLAIAVASAALLLTGYEGLWRGKGARVDHVDNPARWSFIREQVDELGPSDTVLLGKSRIQLAWSFDTYREMIPGTRILSLAVDGVSPWGALEDLVRNTSFAGVVIVSLTARDILPSSRDDLDDYLSYYSDQWNFNKKLNFLIDDYMQQHLISRNQAFSIGATARRLIRDGELRNVRYFLATTRERERSADYALADIERQSPARPAQDEAANRPLAPAVWAESVARLATLVAPLSRRGARVVFLRMPTGPDLAKADELEFPRDRYWDDLAARVPGYWLHSRDIEGVDAFELPDGSHLDRRDKAAMTRLVIERLRQAGIY